MTARLKRNFTIASIVGLLTIFGFIVTGALKYAAVKTNADLGVAMAKYYFPSK